MIEIQGLSRKQMVLADIMWAISSREGVDSFIATLPKADQRECEIVKEMMLLAFIDQCDDTQIASRVIQQVIDKK
jgi:hypothetical protein